CRLRLLFFFQAEDGIRDRNVTGVQTCALPIYPTTVMKKQHLLFQYLSPPLMRYQLLDREQEVRHWRIILNAWRNWKVYLIPLPESKSHMRYKQDVKCASW